jgi:hypothetical protein
VRKLPKASPSGNATSARTQAIGGRDYLAREEVT